jgi:hypothetical protein
MRYLLLEIKLLLPRMQENKINIQDILKKLGISIQNQCRRNAEHGQNDDIILLSPLDRKNTSISSSLLNQLDEAKNGVQL